MNKAEMADRLAARTGLSKAAAREAVDGVFAAIGDALANGEEVQIVGFGTFGTRSRPARTARNLRTGEAVSVSASTSPPFKARKTLKDTVNGGRDHEGTTREDRDWKRRKAPACGIRALLYDNEHPTSCQAAIGESQSVPRVGGYAVAAAHSASRIR